MQRKSICLTEYVKIGFIKGKSIMPKSIIDFLNNVIHLLKGTSVIKYLQLYPEFGNHYLNITANIGRDDPAPSNFIQ